MTYEVAPVNFKSFTGRGRELIRQSLNYAASYKHGHVGIEHLLLALTDENSDASVARHSRLKGYCERIREEIRSQIRPGAGEGSRDVPQSPAAKMLLIHAMQVADSLGHMGVNPEHMFLALFDLGSETLVTKIRELEQIDITKLCEALTAASELDKYRMPSLPGDDV